MERTLKSGRDTFCAMTTPVRKPLLVLDLDESLLHSVDEDEMDAATIGKLKKNYSHFRIDRYHCFLRPKAIKFLKWASEHFEIAIWTAASPDYGYYVLDVLFQQSAGVNPIIILTSDHTALSEITLGNHKDLRLIWAVLPQYGPHNTYMIDDRPDVGAAYPCNVYTIPPFAPTLKKTDQALCVAKGHLLRSLRNPEQKCLLNRARRSGRT